MFMLRVHIASFPNNGGGPTYRQDATHPSPTTDAAQTRVAAVEIKKMNWEQWGELGINL